MCIARIACALNLSPPRRDKDHKRSGEQLIADKQINSDAEHRSLDAGPMIELRGVEKSYGDNVVLRGVDLAVSRGDVVAVIGPSGGGKSTLLRCINLLERHTAGQVVIEGHDITNRSTDLNKIRQRVGMVFQQFNLFPHLNVMDNLTLACRKLRKTPRSAAEPEAEVLLDRVGVKGKETSNAPSIVGGPAAAGGHCPIADDE